MKVNPDCVKQAKRRFLWDFGMFEECYQCRSSPQMQYMEREDEIQNITASRVLLLEESCASEQTAVQPWPL